MKRLVCLMLVFVLCAALLAGCKPTPQQTDPTGAPATETPT